MRYQTKLNWDTSFLMDISNISFQMFGYYLDIFHVNKKETSFAVRAIFTTVYIYDELWKNTIECQATLLIDL